MDDGRLTPPGGDAPLAVRLGQQAGWCGRHGSPLTEALLRGAATDVEAGGPTAELLGPHEHDPVGSVVPLRLAAALHRLVLERQAPELALHYPSVGGTAPAQAVWPVAERVVRDQAERLRELVRRPVQTNEVGRSAALFAVLCLVADQTGLPVRLLELGASAGLNLRCDAFAYEVSPTSIRGDVSSPVRLAGPWRGAAVPDVAPVVASRAGCDPSPVDPTTTDGRLTLTACVWGDQRDRLERLRAALQVADRLPAPVERLGAEAFLRRELAAPAHGVVTVVWHSVVWQYVDPAERSAVEALFEDAGRKRPASAPLLRVALEPERVDGDVVFGVRTTSWPGGRHVHAADCLGHGPPVRWRRSGANLFR